MERIESIYMTYEEVRQFLRRSRPQVDRYRDPKYCAEHGLPSFPEPIGPGRRNHNGRMVGAMLFIKHEVFEYAKLLSQRLRPPADAS